MLPAAPPPVESVAAVSVEALQGAAAAGGADVVLVSEGDGVGVGVVVAVAEGAGDDADAEGVEEVGGALLDTAGLGLGPQAARSSSEAAAVVVTRPVLMR